MSNIAMCGIFVFVLALVVPLYVVVFSWGKRDGVLSSHRKLGVKLLELSTLTMRLMETVKHTSAMTKLCAAAVERHKFSIAETRGAINEVVGMSEDGTAQITAALDTIMNRVAELSSRLERVEEDTLLLFDITNDGGVQDDSGPTATDGDKE